ncbi:MAG TPA: hypothetical protein VKT33_04275 [Candidatus Angelobacter sp.]|nr:hypothetical protein [Candidatus Angelobacter sp.]
MMPANALVYIEAKDFTALLHDWNSSPEKARWIRSDNYNVFSNSRLFLRLSKASDEFAAAAGVPPSMDFLNQAAGTESAIAIYDIGQLEFLYIARTSSGSFLQSPLWQSRNKFEPRSAGGMQFFTRSDADSGRVVAFAMAGDYLILGTRDDLVAEALELFSSSKGHNLNQEGWYTQALAAAPQNAGDLRMVLHMEKVAVTPHFRTYWIQHNITQMQSYMAAVSDLYREGTVYREERVILPKKANEDDAEIIQSAQAVTALLPLVPKEYGFYQAATADAQNSLGALEQKILAPSLGTAPAQQIAPQIQLTSGEAGSGSDLETRIDVEQAPRVSGESASSGLQKQFAAAVPQAMLTVQGTRKNQNDVLLHIPAVVVIAAANNWDAAAVQKAIQDRMAPGLTAARLGLQWRDTNDGYFELDGLYPVEMAARGKLLYFSNNAEMLTAVLRARAVAAVAPVSYAAGFNHTRERQNFYDLSRLADQSAGNTSTYGDQTREPQFFSGNIASFSHAFARLDSEEVITRTAKNKVQQTITYHWSQ